MWSKENMKNFVTLVWPAEHGPGLAWPPPLSRNGRPEAHPRDPSSGTAGPPTAARVAVVRHRCGVVCVDGISRRLSGKGSSAAFHGDSSARRAHGITVTDGVLRAPASSQSGLTDYLGESTATASAEADPTRPEPTGMKTVRILLYFSTVFDIKFV